MNILFGGGKLIGAILFDKDGTLLDLQDTWLEPTITTLEGFLTKHLKKEMEVEEALMDLGIVNGVIQANSIVASGTVKEQIDYLVNVSNQSPEEIGQIFAEAYENFIRDHVTREQLVPDAIEVLEELGERFFIGLITNDSLPTTNQILDQLELHQYFDFIGTADIYGPKPQPAALEVIRDTYGFSFTEMVYVGDSIVDMEYGKLTGGAIAFTNGELHQDHVIHSDYVIHTLREIPDLIQHINQEKEG